MTAKDRARQWLRVRGGGFTDADWQEVRRLAVDRYGPTLRLEARTWNRLIEEVRSRRKGAAGNGSGGNPTGATHSTSPNQGRESRMVRPPESAPSALPSGSNPHEQADEPGHVRSPGPGEARGEGCPAPDTPTPTRQTKLEEMA